MNDILVSRRGFIKGTGMAVMAAACSGMLTGCSGGSSGESNEATLGDFKTKVLSASAVGETTIGSENSLVYTVKPQIKLTFIGSGFNGVKYSDAFSMTIDGKKMDIEEDKWIVSTDFPVIDISKVYSPVFYTKDSAVYNKFEKGDIDAKLTVTFNQQKAVYTVTSLGNQKCKVELDTSNS